MTDLQKDSIKLLLNYVWALGSIIFTVSFLCFHFNSCGHSGLCFDGQQISIFGIHGEIRLYKFPIFGCCDSVETWVEKRSNR